MLRRARAIESYQEMSRRNWEASFPFMMCILYLPVFILTQFTRVLSTATAAMPCINVTLID